MSFLLSIRMSFLVKEKKIVQLRLLSQDSQPSSFPSRLNFITSSKSLCPRSHKLGVALRMTFGFCPPCLSSPGEPNLSVCHLYSHRCSSMPGPPERRKGSTGYIVEYYSAMKKKESIDFAGKGMGLEGTVLSEETRVETDKPHTASLICGSPRPIFTYVYLRWSVCRGQTTRKGPIKETLRDKGEGGNRTCDMDREMEKWGERVRMGSREMRGKQVRSRVKQNEYVSVYIETVHKEPNAL